MGIAREGQSLIIKRELKNIIFPSLFIAICSVFAIWVLSNLELQGDKVTFSAILMPVAIICVLMQALDHFQTARVVMAPESITVYGPRATQLLYSMRKQDIKSGLLHSYKGKRTATLSLQIERDFVTNYKIDLLWCMQNTEENRRLIEDFWTTAYNLPFTINHSSYYHRDLNYKRTNNSAVQKPNPITSNDSNMVKAKWECQNCGAHNSGKTDICIQCMKSKEFRHQEKEKNEEATKSGFPITKYY